MKVERSYPSDARYVSHARAFVTEVVGPAPQPFLFDLQLMTSELVNNAIVHAGSDCVVSVTTLDGLITVAISDTGHGDPMVRTPGDDEPSGRGLRIVEALSRSWGTEPADPGPGKVVWFTVFDPSYVI